jgi:dienelactone hydrolase
MFAVREAYNTGGWRKGLSSRFLELIIASTVWSVLPGCGAQWVSFNNTSSQVESIRGSLMKPDGDGPFPAMVILHTSGGLDNNIRGWAYSLNKLGYVTLAVDTFGSRRLSNCSLSRHLLCSGTGAEAMISDAYGAIAYLAGLPFVDGQKVSIMGLSLGGTAVNRLASRARPRDRNFKTAIALYGRCDFSDYDSIPLLQIFGEHENYAIGCKFVTSKAVEVHVLPGVYHAFDNSTASGRRDVGGNYMQYDAGASKKASEIIQAFLAKHGR